MVSLKRAADIRLELLKIDPYLLTSTNLLGVAMRALDASPSQAAIAEVVTMAHDLRRKSVLTSDAERRCGALGQAATVLATAGSVTAALVARDAVRAAAALGTRRPAIRAYAGAVRVHRKCGEFRRAERLAEETIQMIARFREEGGPSVYRMSLSNEYADVFDNLFWSLEARGAPADDMWWAIDRKCARTLTENLGAHAPATELTKQQVEQLRSILTPEDCILQVFSTGDQGQGTDDPT